MTILPANLDYSDKDFDSLRARLLLLLRQVFPDWTDTAVTNFGMVLLEMFAFVGDVLTKYQDNQAGEAFMEHAVLRRSLIALAKMLGYVPSGRTAATVDETFTLASVPAGEVTIPEGTIVRTSGAGAPLEFRLLNDVVIAALADPPTGTGSAEHSSLNETSATSTLLPGQRIILGTIPFVRVVSLTAGNGIYTKVNNFLQSRSDDRHFTVTVDAQDRATIALPDGENGEIPTGTIEIAYTTGGGASGNVAASTINKISGAFTDDLSNTVSVTVTNAAAASGGGNRETNEQIRQNAPASLRVLTRAVAREDFEIAATTMTATARALHLTSDQDPAIPENTGYMFVIPTGGGLPSQELKDEIELIFDTPYEDGGLPKTVTFKLFVLDPVYVTVDVFAVVYLSSGANAATVDASIRSNIASFFQITLADGSANPEVNFGFSSGVDGGDLPLSSIMNVVRDTDGVRKLGDGVTEFMVNDAHADVVLDLREFPTLGTITLINGATQETLA